MQNLIISVFIFIVSGAFATVFGQTPLMKPVLVPGVVTTVSERTITFNSAKGTVEASLSDKTEYKRASPDNLRNTSPSALGEIKVGDNIIVSGFPSADGKSIPAIRVYLLAKADIEQKNAKETEQWKTRGITGKVTAINPQTNQITLEIRSLMGATTTVLTPKQDAKFIRYAPDSAKFSEAKPSTFTEIAKGDSLRALGDKSADGTSFTAEEIITGAFQSVVGTVKSVDIATNEVVITDLNTKKDVTISLGSVSVMKKFPAEFAERMAGMGQGGMRPAGQGVQPGQGGQPGQTGQGGTPTSGTPTPGAPGQGTPGAGRPGGFGGGRGGSVDDMLERFPNITAADLKVGDVIAISSTKTAPDAKIKAIKLLAGVEPFIRMAPMAAAAQGGGGGQGRPVSLGIPGLDGFGGQ